MPSDGLPLPQRRYAMAVVILGITMAVLDGTIVNLALPGIARDLHAFPAQSIWVVNAYQIATVSLLLPFATLGDLVGYRRVYLSGIALFTAASLGCALSPALNWLAVTRAVQGVGAAAIMSVNAALVRLIYPREQLGKGVAINSLVVAAASVAGPSVAAAILSHATWPWLFVINAPLGIFISWLGPRVLPEPAETRTAARRLSWPDVLLNVALFGLLFLGADALGVRPTGADAALSPRSGAALLAISGAVALLYFRRQCRQTTPIFAVDLLRIPVFALSMCTSVAAFTAQMLSYVVLPFLFLDTYGHTPYQAGLLITAWPLAIVLIAPWVGRMIGRIPDGLLGGIGLAVLSIGLALLGHLPARPDDIDIVWRLILCGLGFGLFQSPNNHTIVSTAPVHRSGAASGMLGTARLTGQTLGALCASVIFSLSDPHSSQGPTIALYLAAGFAALASIFSALRLSPQRAENTEKANDERP